MVREHTIGDIIQNVKSKDDIGLILDIYTEHEDFGGRQKAKVWWFNYGGPNCGAITEVEFVNIRYNAFVNCGYKSIMEL